MKTKKNFVLDTNVILHDFKCLNSFEENDIYIPMMVLEELDHFKKGNAQVNFNARQFARELDQLNSDALFNEGLCLGEGRGCLFILTQKEYPKEVADVFTEKIPDHYILGAAYALSKKHPDTKTILVTKDINLLLKARAIGLLAEDYISDKVTNMDVFAKEQEIFENIDATLIDTMYNKGEGIPIDEFPFKSDVEANECFLMKSDRSSILARYNPMDQCVHRIQKQRAFGIEPRNAEQTFAMNVLLDPDIKLVALTGMSGTGKTLLALAAALQSNEIYQQILLARPVMALADKDLGALPGDAQEKVMPYMQPLFDNLNVIKHSLAFQNNKLKIIEELMKDKRFTIEALAYIRGRSLSETYFIVDEAQNLTPHEIKTIITRAAEGTKIVFTGDIHQIDSPYLDMQSNGLVYMIDRMKGNNLFAHINLVKGERSELSELASQLL